LVLAKDKVSHSYFFETFRPSVLCFQNTTTSSKHCADFTHRNAPTQRCQQLLKRQSLL